MEIAIRADGLAKRFSDVLAPPGDPCHQVIQSRSPTGKIFHRHKH